MFRPFFFSLVLYTHICGNSVMRNHRTSALWNNRDLILTLAISDLKLRYRNSFLGFLWSIIEPLLMLLVLFVIFSTLLKSSIPDYPLFLLLGLVLWYMFNRSTNMGLVSIVGRAGILTQTYFPRSVPAISACLTASFMMLFEFAVLGVFMVAYSFLPPVTIFLLPIVLIFEFIFALGVSLALSVLNVYFRDFQYIWAIVLQAGFFLMPVFYQLTIFSPGVGYFLSLVPLARILIIGRDVALYGIIPPLEYWAYTFLSSLLVLAMGYLIFRRLEGRVTEEL